MVFSSTKTYLCMINLLVHHAQVGSSRSKDHCQSATYVTTASRAGV